MRMKRFFSIFFCCSSVLLTSVLKGQDTEAVQPQPLVVIRSDVSDKMMDPTNHIRKTDVLLEEAREGHLDDRQLIIGASIIGIMDYQVSNMDSKFGYLMRHPTAGNQIGTVVSEAVLHSFQMAITASVNNWIRMYGEFLYDPQQSFGPGTNTALTRNQLQLRKGFILFGDLNKFPLYGALGKMDTPFGDMGSVNPFSNSTSWHAFAGLGFGAEIGFKKAGFHASFMAIQGGSQFRAAHTGVNGTNVPSRLNNFAVDMNYTVNLAQNSTLQLGTSYIYGSAYCTGWPITHFGEPVKNNPAYGFYGNLHVNELILVKTGYSITVDNWPGSYNPNPPLNQYGASKVSALNGGVKVGLNKTGAVKYAVSGEYSEFRCGPSGSPWERQNQKILGFEAEIKKSSTLFAEVFHTRGYVPLNFMTGGNMESPGETHSERGAYSYGIVVGARIVL